MPVQFLEGSRSSLADGAEFVMADENILFRKQTWNQAAAHLP